MSALRKSKLFLTVLALVVLSFASFLYWASGRHVVPILMYHSIEKVSGRSYGITVSPESFKKHMQYLKDHRYHVISLDELVTAIKEKKPLPQKSVAITFDDGYDNNYSIAFKILKDFKFPATIFVIASVVGEDGYFAWDQAKEMERYGITIGSHTLDHTYLPGAPAERQRQQIQGSKKFMEEKLGHPVEYIAYPSGGFTEEIKEITKQAGYKGACTTNRGYARINEDIYELKRVSLKNADNDFTLGVKLSGYYNLFRSPKDPS